MPPSRARRPTRHINTSRKIADWYLAIRQKNLIIGDSNLSIIQSFCTPDLQIDSFPRATFHHIRGVIAKIDVAPTIELVILSLGITNHSQMFQTAVKNC